MNIIKTNCYECNNSTYSFDEINKCFGCSSNCITTSILSSFISVVQPRSIVITLSYGILDPFTYSEVDIFHVGLSNSKCQIYNFWNEYKIDSQKGIWIKTICIDLISIIPEILNIKNDDFDSILDQNMYEQKSKFGKYHQLDNNCFDYVCRFLNTLFEIYKIKVMSKNEFCEIFINEKIMEFEKFSRIYKRLKKDKIFTVNENDDNKLSKPCVAKICDICGILVSEGSYIHCDICMDFDICIECNSSYPHLH